MVERVDAGPIVGVKMFNIPTNTSVLRLQELAFVELARLFWRLAPALAGQSEPIAELFDQVERNKEHASILCGNVRHPCRHLEGRTGAPDRGVRRRALRCRPDRYTARPRISLFRSGGRE